MISRFLAATLDAEPIPKQISRFRLFAATVAPTIIRRGRWSVPRLLVVEDETKPESPRTVS